MSYTSVEQVRGYLTSAFPVSDRIVDQQVTLSGTEYVTFYGAAVDSSTVVVKSLQTNSLTRAAITLGTDANAFSASPISRGSVAVASDSSLGTIYAENADYIISYESGTLTIKTGGVLSAGMTVTIWFLPFTTYQSGADYTLDNQRGRIKRLAGGSIASAEAVRLDFVPLQQSFDDELLESAVVQANGMIEHEIDSSGSFGASPVLQALATYRALEIICHAAAVRELSRRAADDRAALAWMKLADAYELRSEKLFRTFRPASGGPNMPAVG